MGVLRCLLALSVLLVHDMDGWFKLIDGAAAVQCFFLISGFYMALVLNERYADVGRFYYNRALRLLPTYWAVLLLTLVAAALAGRPTFIHAVLQSDLTWDARALVLVSSVFLVGSDVMLFVRPTEAGLVFTAGFWNEPPYLFAYHPIPPAWSLPVEMAFYALAPFLVRSRWRLLAGVLLGLAIRVIVYKAFGSHDPWQYRFFPAELGVFCAGGLAYHCYRAMQADVIARQIGAGCLALLIAAMLAHPYLPPTARYVPITALMLASLPFVFALTRDSTTDRWLGELSYPVYLLHFPVLQCVSGTLAVIACTAAAAIVVHRTVQVTAEGARKRGRLAGDRGLLRPPLPRRGHFLKRFIHAKGRFGSSPGRTRTHMAARIYKPARTAMQSGPARTKEWVLEYEPEVAREIDPLMGWTSSRDMKQQLQLSFDSKDEAVAYAERNGIPYRLPEPKPRQPVRKSYSDNFRFGRIGSWTH